MTNDEIDAELHGLKLKESDLRALKKQRWPTKCCRCWPSAIDEKGWCSCCDMNHVTGMRDTFTDPEYGL